MTQTIFARPALIIAASVAMLSSLPAMASEEGSTIPTQETVRFNNADLATDTGVANVRAKITRAARAACLPNGYSLDDEAHSKICFERAVAQGNSQLETMIAERQTEGAATLVIAGSGATRTSP